MNEIDKGAVILYDHLGYAFTAGFLQSQLVLALDCIPKKQRDTFLMQFNKTIENCVGSKFLAENLANKVPL